MTVRRSFPLSFIPLVPYPPLRATFPSRGRLTIRGYRHLKCGETATRALSPSYQSTHSSFLPPSFGRRCPEGAEVGSRSGISLTGMPPPPRFARLPLPEEGARMIFKETLIQSLSFAVKNSRLHICRAVPLSSSVFHAACALSAPAGHLPLEGQCY